MRELVVVYDSREQYCLLLPAIFYWRPDAETTVFSVRAERRRITTGDYFLDGHRSVCIVERKASVPELSANLFGAPRKRRNFLSALDRLAGECEHPYMFLDMRWEDMWRDKDADGKMILRCPFGLYDHLMQELNARKIGVIGPQEARTVTRRRIAGDWILRQMVNHAFPRRSHSVEGVLTSAWGNEV